MKAVKLPATILLICLCLITPLPALATNQANINGKMDSSEPWIHWFSDQTWSFNGYPHRQLPGNTLGFDAYYFSDNSKLYVFIKTDDNTAGDCSRDKFEIYFDVFPYGRGPEDFAYTIEVPSILYGGGLKLNGPNWWETGKYSGIAASSEQGKRTFEVAIPLSDLVPNKNNVNYRTAKMMLYLENYGDKLWAENKVVNCYPDQVNPNNYQKKLTHWQQIDLSTLCPAYFNIQPACYTLKINTVGGGFVTLDPDLSSYVAGTTVQLTANPNDGWQFVGWSGDSTGNTNTTSIIINSNKTVTAAFTQIEYNLTVTSVGEGCLVTKTPNKPAYHYGDVVTLTPVAGAGYTFSNWLGHLTGNSNPATITINENKLVVANFVKSNYSISINYAGTGAGQIVTNASVYHLGDVAMLMAVPEAGSDFAGWSGSLTGNTNPAYIAINGNKTVTATFTKQPATLTVNTIGSGIINKTPSLASYNYGTIVQLTAVPSAGWSFAGWSGDYTGNTNPAVINMTGNMTVYAAFTQNQYTVVLNTSGQGNPTMSPNTPIIYGSIIQLNANPLAGWTFTGWSTNTPEITITNPSQASTTAVINGAGTITATYTQNTYSLTINVNPQQGGLVVADKAGPYHYGDVVTLTAAPSTGYTFGGWSGDAQGSGQTCAVTIDGNKVVNAAFGQTEHVLSVSVSPLAGGLVVADKNAPYHYGDVVTLTAQANPGYSFAGWTGAATGTNLAIQFTVTGDMNLNAIFTQNQYQLTINVIGSGSVTKSFNGPYHYGDNITLTAYPSTGWNFVDWTGTFSSTSNPVIISINSDVILNVTFTLQLYEINTYTTNGYIIISPQQSTYTYGTSIQVTAVPDSGFDFVSFNFGMYPPENSFTLYNSSVNLIVNCSLSISALFAKSPVSHSNVSLTINPSPGGYVIGNASGVYTYESYIKLMAIPNEGYAFSHWVYSPPELFAHPFQLIFGSTISKNDNPLEICLLNNTIITPVFVSSEGLPSLYLTPSVVESPKPNSIGEIIELKLNVENVTNLWGWVVSMAWNPSIIELISVTEGSFLNSAGSTLFLGYFDKVSLPEQVDVLMSLSSVNGSGNLATLSFKVVGYGETNVTITSSTLLEPPCIPADPWAPIPNNPIILHSVRNAAVNIAAPPVTSPIPKFTLPSGGMSYVGDLITLDASNSLAGYDTLPVGQETVNPINSYVWSIDFGNDGSVDLLLYGAIVDLVIPYTGLSSITLTVTAPDINSQTSINYQQTVSLTKLITVNTRPTKQNLDIYTQRGGYFANQSSDSFAPQEQVEVYGLVTYNDVPVIGKDVAFMILDNNGNQIDFRVARTDENGLAAITFRIPWPNSNPQSLFGVWTIIGSVDVSEQVASDVCTFEFNYTVQIASISTLNCSVPSLDFTRNNALTANVTLYNIRGVTVGSTVTVVVCDEGKVPVVAAAVTIEAMPSREEFTISISLPIPKWSFVGLGKVYANVYTSVPSVGGIALGPEVSTPITIQP